MPVCDSRSSALRLHVRSCLLSERDPTQRLHNISEIRQGALMAEQFRDRAEAGQKLAQFLQAYAHQPNVLVLALPRGGVPVGFEIATALGIPLDICLVRKLGVPNHKELAMGAIASDGVRVLNEDIVRAYSIPLETIEQVTYLELQELQRRDQAYRGDRTKPKIEGQTIILVDDGLATGATMRAAIAVLKRQHPMRIVVAVPVAPVETCKSLEDEVDQVICLITSDSFHSLGLWYENFEQTSDEEVQKFLQRAGF